MKSLKWLHITLLTDCGYQLGVNTERDAQTIASRFQAEGESFLTITLPTFADGVLSAIERGYALRSDWPSFKRASRMCLPAFLQGFTQRIFSRDGRLLVEPDESALAMIRQITCVSKKLEAPVSSKRLERARLQYASTDANIPEILPAASQQLRRVFRDLFHDVLDPIETDVYRFDLVPRHGPGSVAEGLSPCAKWEFSEWPDELEDVFPSLLYGQPDPRPRGLASIKSDDMAVKVIFVPKTMKTPRVIAIEPVVHQYAQQALARRLYANLKLAFHGLDLHDQGRNQRLACAGSLGAGYATIDLSEASDRLSWRLVESLFSSWPNILDHMRACRTRNALLPDGSLIRLKKFASMGSALTFPVQSMVFFAIAVMGSELHVDRDPDRKKSLPISVFGDDIIVADKDYSAVAGLLEAFGLKVNSAKSYSRGQFRESCGGDYYRGRDVSYAKAKSTIPSTSADATAVAHTVSLRNQLFLKGYWHTARELDKRIQSLIRWKPGPVGDATLSRYTHCPVPPDRWNPSLQRDEILRPSLVPKGRKYTVNGEAGLLKFFIGSLTPTDGPLSGHEPTERPVAFAIHNRWSAI